MIRSALLLISAATTGVALGRRLLSRAVTRRTDKLIVDAADEVRQQIKQDASSYLARSFKHYAVATAIKVVLLAIATVLALNDWVSPTAFSITTASLLVVFLCRDIWVIMPTLRLATTELHDHGWRPRRAIGEVVAANVFAEVLERSSTLPVSRSENLVLRLAGKKRDDVTQTVAKAVADIARESTWQDLRPFVIGAAVRVITLAAIYSAIVFYVLYLGTNA